MRMIVLVLLILLFGCGRRETPEPDYNEPQKESLQEIKARLEPMIVRDSIGSIIKTGETGDGDSTMWNGLMCISGDTLACEAARVSQEENGRIRRSPSRVGTEEVDSASRDMLLGFLLYLIKTKDQEAANRLLDYLRFNDNKLCPTSTDNRCWITPAVWGTMKLVWQFIGLTPSANMIAGNFGDETALSAQALSCTDFECHLLAVRVLIHRRCSAESTLTMKAMSTLVEKEPENAFFRYLKGDYEVAYEKIQQYAPKEQPAEQWQWYFERPWIQYNNNNVMTAMWVFLINMLTNTPGLSFK